MYVCWLSRMLMVGYPRCPSHQFLKELLPDVVPSGYSLISPCHFSFFCLLFDYKNRLIYTRTGWFILHHYKCAVIVQHSLFPSCAANSTVVVTWVSVLILYEQMVSSGKGPISVVSWTAVFPGWQGDRPHHAMYDDLGFRFEWWARILRSLVIYTSCAI